MQALTAWLAFAKDQIMPTTDEAKHMARALREALGARSTILTHSQSLELVAQTLGHADWNTFAAKAAPAAAKTPDGAVSFEQAVPILRIFDLDKAKSFYIGYLGFRIDWEHRFAADYPHYLQVSRAELVLHLSEHHGDATPGSASFIYVYGLEQLQRELAAKGSHANLEEGPGNLRVLQILDPFGNRLRFAERRKGASRELPEGYRVPAG